MYEPTRGGTRGGQAEFKWSDVSADKDREVGPFITLHFSTGLTFTSMAILTLRFARCRTTLAIRSTHPQGDGKRTKMYTGTTGT